MLASENGLLLLLWLLWATIERAKWLVEWKLLVGIRGERIECVQVVESIVVVVVVGECVCWVVVECIREVVRLLVEGETIVLVVEQVGRQSVIVLESVRNAKRLRCARARRKTLMVADECLWHWRYVDGGLVVEWRRRGDAQKRRRRRRGKRVECIEQRIAIERIDAGRAEALGERGNGERTAGRRDERRRTGGRNER